MKRLVLYLDTSVLGGLLDRDPPERRPAVEALLSAAARGDVMVLVSRVVLEEINRLAPERREVLLAAVGRSEVLEETPETLALAAAYVVEGALPAGAADDARHLALATLRGVDALVSWNHRHMVNLRVRRLIAAVNLKFGYRSLDVVTPEEVMGSEGKVGE